MIYTCIAQNFVFVSQAFLLAPVFSSGKQAFSLPGSRCREVHGRRSDSVPGTMVGWWCGVRTVYWCVMAAAEFIQGRQGRRAKRKHVRVPFAEQAPVYLDPNFGRVKMSHRMFRAISEGVFGY